MPSLSLSMVKTENRGEVHKQTLDRPDGGWVGGSGSVDRRMFGYSCTIIGLGIISRWVGR